MNADEYQKEMQNGKDEAEYGKPDSTKQAPINAGNVLIVPNGISKAEELAKMFHEAYEELAPEHGYETRKESAKPWEEVPEQNKNLMIATVKRVFIRWANAEIKKLDKKMEKPIEDTLELSSKLGTRKMLVELTRELQER